MHIEPIVAKNILHGTYPLGIDGLLSLEPVEAVYAITGRQRKPNLSFLSGFCQAFPPGTLIL